MRIFALLGALLVALCAYFAVDGGIRCFRCMQAEVFQLRIWSKEFWFIVPESPALGLGPNAQWLLRLGGGLLGLVVGTKVIRVAPR